MKRFLPVLALLWGLCLSAHAQDAYRPIEQRMPMEEQRAIGIDQMTPQQLARLNAWLRTEAGEQEQVVREQIKEERKGFGGFFGGGKEAEPIVSKIDGEFSGWSNRTVFRLHNGQSWRVINTPEYYVPKRKATVDPAVSITQSLMGSWRLQVEGHALRAMVQRVD